MKDGFSIGYTVQIADYEPVKLAAWAEEEHDGLPEDEVSMRLATKIMARLETLSIECVKKIESIKANMMDELDD